MNRTSMIADATRGRRSSTDGSTRQELHEALEQETAQKSFRI
jgi:hypothetical protein